MSTLYSPLSSEQSPRELTSPSFSSVKTPVRNRGLYSRLKYSEPSQEYFNTSFSDHTSTENADFNDKHYEIKPNKSNKSDYLNELESCKQEISKLKVKILKMKNSGVKPREPLQTNSKELALKLKKQREFLEKQYKARLVQQREEVKKELLNEIEAVRGTNKLRELEEYYENEFSLAEKEHEAKLRIKIAQVKTEYERNLARVQEENLALKKLNEGLKRQLEDFQAKSEVRKTLNEKPGLFGTFEDDRELKDIKERYSELQKDYVDLKKREKAVLCVRCKAAANADKELNSKLERLKSFLESD